MSSCHWKVLVCRSCKSIYLAPPECRRSRQRCDSCQRQHKLEQNRKFVAASRARKREMAKKSDTQHSAPREFQLICGHRKLFRVPLIEGELIWCERCDDFIEYAGNITRPLCPAQIHRMTPFNTVCHPKTRRKVCRRCLEEQTGQSFLSSLSVYSGEK